MKKYLCLILLLFLFLPVTAAAEQSDESIIEQLESETSQFNPEEVGKQMEQKAEELIGLAKSGSSIYGALALIVFLALLIGGLFWTKLIKLAFFFLIIALAGFFILNFWPEIQDGIKAIINWVFAKGDANETTSGV